MKKAVVSVTNDLINDQRAHKICLTLMQQQYEVWLVGRKLKNSLPIELNVYKTKRIRLLINKGPLFYAFFNIHLFFYLLFKKADLLYSNDLDTLLPNFIISKIKKIPLLYDSHEYFTEVPELIGRPTTRKIWLWIEKKLLSRMDFMITVSASIAKQYEEKYNIKAIVVRNVPLKKGQNPEMPEIYFDKKNILIYQGSLNKGRGLENMILSMQYLPEANLVIAGKGDIEKSLRNIVKQNNIKNVFFIGIQRPENLYSYTFHATLGISVEESTGLNYLYALPNKIFDYIQAGIPVMVSELPEMNKIIEKYKVGFINTHTETQKFATKIREAIFNEELMQQWKTNTIAAGKELIWENESEKLIDILENYITK